MVRFNCDYSEGAHPSIMERLLQTNMLQTAGYGEDDYCEEARDRKSTRLNSSHMA